MSPSPTRILPLAEYPAALSLCARWNFEQWARDDGETLEEVVAALDRISQSESGENAFVALVDGAPAGMVLLIDCDLSSHAHLTPWVAGVYVEPVFRGRGVAAVLVAAAEKCARGDGHAEAFLYSAIPELYVGLGWRVREILSRENAGMSLMSKRL